MYIYIAWTETAGVKQRYANVIDRQSIPKSDNRVLIYKYDTMSEIWREVTSIILAA